MMSYLSALLLLTTLASHIISNQQTSARILLPSEAAKELIRGGIPRMFISSYICLIKSESNFDTRKKTGPGHKASYSYGILQISSDKWCSAFRPGGVCRKNCNDFLDDDIQDDIACAKIIANQEGFKYWKGWVKSCKNNNFTSVSSRLRKQSNMDNDRFRRLGIGREIEVSEEDLSTK
ncbi:PREDICTED: lysozyme c-1 [Ceratosolen solmsi marchali]|uniref:lysozyme n=1 Tax=Ceratosolen solmsi marchali TaxID=326594 RepID=A0AAJ6YBG0_9HYME|nr:PREDICTED: lysozyme c-1 [Ceratosolen solmsi marchali]